MKSKLHKSNLRVGCSGFRYLKWCGSFYTKDATLEEMLRHYSANFDSVEIRDTYHGFLRSGTYEAWLDTVPEHFTFSIKAPHYFLADRAGPARAAEWADFLKSLDPLRKKGALGALLLQVPPVTEQDGLLLKNWLETYVRPDLETAFEFRHDSWFIPETLDLLARFGADAACAHLPETEPRVDLPGKIKYFRLLVPKRALNYDYAYNSLVPWGERLRALQDKVDRVYLYFNNPGKGQAPVNARNLVKRILNPSPDA
jgi:uncharacterized protein YecE (DUF72 family)